MKAIAQARLHLGMSVAEGTDKVDARTLAHLLRADLIPKAFAPQGDARVAGATVGPLCLDAAAHAGQEVGARAFGQAGLCSASTGHLR